MKVGELLRDIAARYSDRLAAVCGDAKLTYAELDEQSNRLANALLARGLTLGDRLIVYLPNTMGCIVAMVAAAKAGALSVPVSTRLTAQELAFIAADCKPFGILFSPEYEAQAKAALAEAPNALPIMVDGGASLGGVTIEDLIQEGAPDEPPQLPRDFDDAMIGYTAGTTGTPKGAIITHANQIWAHFYCVTMYRLTEDDVTLVTSPLAHRTGFARMMTGLCLGTPVIALPRFDAPEMVRLINEYNITSLAAVPTVARMFLDYLDGTDVSMPSLRYIVSGGEHFPFELKERLKARLPDVGLIVFYGSTEGGGMASLEPEEQMARPGSTGRPWPGVEMKLMDEDGNQVPQGEAGEIWVRTGIPGNYMVFREYYNRPDANQASFTDGWFHTGDVGKFDEDGYLYIVDRVKDMILSGGLNIFSKEVEQAILSLDGVSDAAVCGAPDPEWGEAVVAFVIAHDGAQLSAEQVIEHVKGKIASYKKPKHVFFVDDFPRNSVGKILKSDLRADALSRTGQSAARAAS